MPVQDISGILAEGPGQLLDRSLEEYGALLRTAGELKPELLEAVDYTLRHTVVRLLSRATREKENDLAGELVEAYDALRRLVPPAREAELAAWLPRWRGFADLLDARLATLASRDVAGALRLAHSSEILAEVAADPGLTQAQLGLRLGLKPANLSRILSVLEAHELIERRSVGRERRLHPGHLARPAGEAPNTALPAGASAIRPGNEYLRLVREDRAA